MDIFDVLTSDHDKVKKILEQVEQTSARADEVAKRFKELKKEAPAHAV
jgi:queuine/archaeosine tRNA-ribosyltransferase